MFALTLVACSEPAARPHGGSADWYRRSLARDFTSDQRTDSIVVSATGSRSDSLLVELSIFVDKQKAFSAQWQSQEELLDLTAPFTRPPRSDSVVRAHLDGILADLRYGPLDTGSVRALGDTAVLALVKRTGKLPSELTFSFGYESSYGLVWDPATRQFLIAYSCC